MSRFVGTVALSIFWNIQGTILANQNSSVIAAAFPYLTEHDLVYLVTLRASIVNLFPEGESAICSWWWAFGSASREFTTWAGDGSIIYLSIFQGQFSRRDVFKSGTSVSVRWLYMLTRCKWINYKYKNCIVVGWQYWWISRRLLLQSWGPAGSFFCNHDVLRNCRFALPCAWPDVRTIAQRYRYFSQFIPIVR